ncbi:NAD(P)/FAD-dependent oxidoreductase [Hymenobacter crusticola]|uniref:FAD-binding domain-containing protein n=1 Tax=Hymenobacter crusticola TaxID=1770526 RepID=A0A243WI51_9BACT|nr:geranylgeranyl reductase family protein [Hymenobacter crusticola]OUJ75495.1 hypothetical protein BXP70_05645 [Hymenobacter crusticola]
MSTAYDVAIIGAGPAGTACALALRGSGLRVVLLDRAKFPRDKVCGDIIPSPALKALRTLSMELYEEILALTRKAEAPTSCLITPDGHQVRFHWKGRTFNSARLHFDEHLLNTVKKHTDVHVLESKPVVGVALASDHAVLTTADGDSLTARLVIGCDGANSVVARKLTPRSFDRTRHCVAVRAYFSGVTNMPERTNELYFLREYLPGYFWVFPVGEGMYNVGFGMLSATAAAQKLDLKKVLLAIVQEHPQVAGRFVDATQISAIGGAGLPLGGTQRPIAGAGFLLAGDAASLVEPLLGHGIDTAMQSGMLAAEQVKRCFASQDFSAAAMQYYTHAVQEKLGRKLARNYWLMRFLSNKPRLVSASFRLASNSLLQKWLVRAVG